MSNMGWRCALLALVAAGVLSACGGGGGGTPAPGETKTVAPRAPLPALLTDSNPTGERLDYRSRDYFVAALGDRWNYDILDNGQPTAFTMLREVTSVVGADVVLTETSGSSSNPYALRLAPEGIVNPHPLSDAAPLAARQIVGTLLEYPEPFYPVGQERVVVRQGSWGADLDDDGIPESFRFEYRQTLVGLEARDVAGHSLTDVAHFRNVLMLTVQPSDARFASYTVTSLENSWWAPGVGLVHYDRRGDGSDGEVVTAPFSLVLTGGVVGGETLFAPKPDGVVTKIALLHNDLVYDALRGVYYASVPGSVAVNGNRIAIINASTGVVSYSATAVGSEPGELAVSADGSALYVGLNGSGQVVKLALPGMLEQWRVTLPTDSVVGQRYAERISVSPVDSDMVAVSLAVSGVSSRHQGLALIKGGRLIIKTQQPPTNSNLIVFDGDGRYVYGYNAESTEFGLRRFAVLADGLQEEAMVIAESDFEPKSMDWLGGRLVLGALVYQTPDLTQAGTSPSAGALCVWIHAGAKLVCASDRLAFYDPLDVALDVVNGSTWLIESRSVYQRGRGAGYLRQIVAGPVGTVALSMSPPGSGLNPDRMWLFKSPALE